ncbi:acetolactate synthase-1/2/3 large subunit [Monaibacterium marinum]|uniref:Acetolactate synthase-1/2/3 large subunit n=1 Tax=Pontivivens marinum TaxID=1690039 RepID=A0A2C9CUL4_9RHOB|nr:thiamine pyrophosphate-dependent enzyme [Monaibacterium marinum]SOH94903.1 acetolactate synthase-1/2/3 large subunit [Monaibacterium marinum]
MTHSNGGKLLVRSLIGLGASKSFGVPGESYLAVLDALHDTRDALDFVLCRNEGGAAFMASAYGKLTGKPGLCFVTRGPGATNASIGVHTAMQDSSPMILFVGQIGTGIRGREAFQEIDYRAYFGSVAKWVTEIDDIDRIPEILARAWSTAISGRPGPVVIALPEDMLTSLSDVPALTKASPVHEAAPSDEAMAGAIELLKTAQRPLILMGGGGWNKAGKTAIQRFADASDVPVLAAFRYQDLYDNYAETYVGDAGVGMTPATKDLITQADVILALNIRFGEMTTDEYRLFDAPIPQQKIIHVHVSDREIGKIYVPEIGIHAGPNAFSAKLAQSPISGPWAQWRSKARADYLASFDAPEQPSPVDMVAVTAWLRDRLPQDAILTNGAGNFTVWPNKFFKFGPDQHLLAPQSGAMGYGVPAAIAAKSTYPERTVVCFAGDGDFQMNCQELGTAMQAGAQPIILILNNGIYGTIRMHQERNYPARVSGTTLENPDFVGLAKSYGFHAEHVATTADFAAAFERACASTSGAVLELDIAPEALTPRQTLSQMRTIAQGEQK